MTSITTENSNIIDGKIIAQKIRTEVKTKVAEICREGNEKIKLCVILVGDRKDSATYVKMKQKACIECDIESQVISLAENITEKELVEIVRSLNSDRNVHGILVQLPLPNHLNEETIVDEIDYKKDVDGLHPTNVGFLNIRGRKPLFLPCTAQGCLELCLRYSIDICGANVVVIGRSNIVGLPVAQLFLQNDATVTICHSKTKNLENVCKTADILIAAIGKAEFVKSHWIKDNCTIIDVGINSIPDKTKKSGYRLVGDVDFKNCQNKCKYITPVPGGVGPMTVAILMQNTLNAKLHQIQQ